MSLRDSKLRRNKLLMGNCYNKTKRDRGNQNKNDNKTETGIINAHYKHLPSNKTTSISQLEERKTKKRNQTFSDETNNMNCNKKPKQSETELGKNIPQVTLSARGLLNRSEPILNSPNKQLKDFNKPETERNEQINLHSTKVTQKNWSETERPNEQKNVKPRQLPTIASTNQQSTNNYKNYDKLSLKVMPGVHNITEVNTANQNEQYKKRVKQTTNMELLQPIQQGQSNLCEKDVKNTEDNLYKNSVKEQRRLIEQREENKRNKIETAHLKITQRNQRNIEYEKGTFTNREKSYSINKTSDAYEEIKQQFTNDDKEQKHLQQTPENKCTVDANTVAENVTKTVAFQQLNKIKSDIDNIMLEVEEFKGTTKDRDYIYLDEMLTRNLLKLDNVETEGHTDIRTERRKIIKYNQGCINKLKQNAEKQNAKATSVLAKSLEPKVDSTHVDEKNETSQKEEEAIAHKSKNISHQKTVEEKKKTITEERNTSHANKMEVDSYGLGEPMEED